MKDYKHRLAKQSDEEVEQCCENPHFENDGGNTVCMNCGTISGTHFIGVERRAYSTEEVDKRKQTEVRWRSFGARTVLSSNTVDSKGNAINAKNRTLFSRLSKIQNSLISSIERNFWEAKPRLKLIASKLNLPEYIRETAWKIYSVVATKKLTMGRSIDGFLCASVYAAIRIHNFPKLLDEICDASLIPRRTVHKSLGIVVKEVLPELNLKYRPITAEQLVFKFGNDLGLPMETQRTAAIMLTQAFKKGISHNGKDPRGFAASAIYIAAKENNMRKTQAEVAEVANITEVTLRTRIKDIKKNLR